jgi:hypothetical protein
MESFGLHAKKIIANFHILGLFMPKKRVWSEKKILSVSWLAVGFWTKFEAQLAQPSKVLES